MLCENIDLHRTQVDDLHFIAAEICNFENRSQITSCASLKH